MTIAQIALDFERNSITFSHTQQKSLFQFPLQKQKTFIQIPSQKKNILFLISFVKISYRINTAAMCAL